VFDLILPPLPPSLHTLSTHPPIHPSVCGFPLPPPLYFKVMSKLAAEHQSVNLGQGFPDDEGPEAMKQVEGEKE